METPNTSEKQRGKPFQKGDPRIKPGPGRPALPPEVKAARRRVVADLAAELKQAADIACDALVEIASNEKAKHSDRIAAAAQILDRSFGRAMQSVDAKVLIEDGVTRISSEDIRKAALAVAGRYAEDVA